MRGIIFSHWVNLKLVLRFHALLIVTALSPYFTKRVYCLQMLLIGAFVRFLFFVITREPNNTVMWCFFPPGAGPRSPKKGGTRWLRGVHSQERGTRPQNLEIDCKLWNIYEGHTARRGGAHTPFEPPDIIVSSIQRLNISACYRAYCAMITVQWDITPTHFDHDPSLIIW